MSLNLGSLLANSARWCPTGPALVRENETYSYAETDRGARRFAAELVGRGIQPGDKVALMAPNSPLATVAYFGTLYAGAVVVTLNTLLTADEAEYQLEDCGAVALIFGAECAGVAGAASSRVRGCRYLYCVGTHEPADQLGDVRQLDDLVNQGVEADLVQTNADDTAVILYTSGTTGKPKGAELTHFNLYYNAKYVSERTLGEWPTSIETLGPAQVGLAALPHYHIFGQTNVQNGMLIGGGTVAFMDRFNPLGAAEAIARHGVTFFPGVPTMFFAILHEETIKHADLATLRCCISGGAPLPVEVKRQFEDRFGVRIREGYGLTETSPLASVQSARDSYKAGCIGKPIDGVEFKIVDEDDREVPPGEAGEILIRGHNVMKGYYKQPAATAEAMRGGWFHSGDMAYVDGDGDVFIIDRKKDLILRGGYNVYPREVEEVLYQHPAVREAVVIGVPDERLGEEVKAVVALKAAATEDEIIAHCKRHVAAYKYPRIVEILPELPKGPTGKLLKRALRER